jgi:hypothetical protein
MSVTRITAALAPRRLCRSLPVVAATPLLAWWIAAGGGERFLLAAPAPADPQQQDLDHDGLIAHQEAILCSLDTKPDTDGDSFDDLVELARGTDLTNAVSIPVPEALNVGMTARSDEGMITLVTAVFVHNAQFPNFYFHFGISVAGVVVELPASFFMASSTLGLYPGMDPSGWVIVLETKVPEVFLQAYGYLGFYSTVQLPGSDDPSAAAVVNLFEADGYAMSLEPTPPGFTPGGSIYKPLPRGEDLPASWGENQVCWQLTGAIGTDGSSVILEIEDAACKPLSTKCSSSACQAGIGTTVKVLDAGALAGGG